MKRKTNQRGFAVGYVLIAIALIGAVLTMGRASTNSISNNVEQTRINNARSMMDNIQTTLISEISLKPSICVDGICSNTSDIGINTSYSGDGNDGVVLPIAGNVPNGDGFNIPAASSAPKVDPWGTSIRYCPYNNGNGVLGSNNTYPSSVKGNDTANTNRFITGDLASNQNSVVFAVISAGQDKVFNTKCEDARQNLRYGDDGIRIVRVIDVMKGLGGTVFANTPLNTLSDLNNVKGGFFEGQTRLIKDIGVVYVFSSDTTSTGANILAYDENNILVGSWSPANFKIGQVRIANDNCSTEGVGSVARNSAGELLICQ